jgi:hypothetical protein
MPRLLPLFLLALSLGLASACTQNTPQKPFPSYAETELQAPAAPAVSGPALFAAHGTVQQVTLDNIGRPTLLILKTGDETREVTFPNELAVPVGGSLTAGDTVDVVIARIGFSGANSDVPVYRLASIRDKNGHLYAAPSMAANRYARVTGNVKSLAKSENGVVSTIQLDTGDVVRVTPRMAKQHPIEVGEQFTANGLAVFLPTGGLFVFAEEINGLSLRTLLPPGGWGRPVYPDDSGEYMDEGYDMTDGGGDFGSIDYGVGF